MSDEIEMIPYLSFRGSCEEALNFYAEILDGRVDIISRYDNPAMKAPEDFKNKILHAGFQFGNNLMFASDTMPKSKEDFLQSNVAMSLGLHDEKRAADIFDRLSEGGKIHIPFKKQFWCDWHGNFTDRFGIRWMINCSEHAGE